jgi:hypothetical protein
MDDSDRPEDVLPTVKFAQGGAVNAGGQPYKVLGPKKIWLSATAREWAREWGMSDREMAKYLLAQNQEGSETATENELPFAFGGAVPGTSGYSPTNPISEEEFMAGARERTF